MHPPAVTALLLAAFVAASTFNLLASASRSGGFSEINVNSIRVQNAARQAVALLNADAPRCRAHNLTVPVTLLNITHANVQIVAGRCHLPLMSPRTVMHAVLRLVSGNESNDTCIPVLLHAAGTIYKLRLVLSDAMGQHDTSIKLFKALPGANLANPAYKLLALSFAHLPPPPSPQAIDVDDALCSWSSFYLPSDAVHPTQYDLYLAVRNADWQQPQQLDEFLLGEDSGDLVLGSVAIHVQVQRASFCMVLHADGMNITDVSFTSSGKAVQGGAG